MPKKPRIKSSNAASRVGAPGFKVGRTVEGFTGSRVSQDKVTKGRIRRLFAQDPSDGKTANIGTKRDILDFNNVTKINPTSGPSPKITNATVRTRIAQKLNKGFGIKKPNRGLKKY